MFKTNSNTSVAKAKPFGLLRVIALGSLFISALILIGTGYYLYNYLFIRLNDISSVLSGNSSDSLHRVDEHRLEKILNVWNSKHATSTPAIPRDIFAGKAATPLTTPLSPSTPPARGL